MMEFGDIFGEPDSNHSFQWTWRLAHRIFTSTSSFIYKLLTVILVIPVAIVFGILFAIFSAISIFICTPLGLLIGMPANAIAKVNLYAFVDFSLIISSIALFVILRSLFVFD
ncbi:unnamed protein product [Anisakis simplex]|uniref:Caveolin n=1 Tax=Anisakis simplex TaxID=6269 RepID=A0A0M3JQD6_ANISI|nr:unnamed protein product [Anisakis simplex]